MTEHNAMHNKFWDKNELFTFVLIGAILLCYLTFNKVAY